MSKTFMKELKEQSLARLKDCIGRKCYIIKEVEPKKYEGILLGIHPTSDKMIFKIIDGEKYEFLIIENGIFICVEKK